MGIELKIPCAKGIPEGSLISIRVGAVRRQAVFGSDRPYRFQGAMKHSELMKVDIYVPIAQARLMLDTRDSQALQSLKLEVPPAFQGALAASGLGGGDMSIDLETNTAVGAKAPGRPVGAQVTRESSAKRHQVAIEAQPYFEQHEVLDTLRELLQVLIKEKPEDPYSFMIQVLENSKKARRSRPDDCKESADCHEPPPPTNSGEESKGCNEPPPPRNICEESQDCDEPPSPTPPGALGAEFAAPLPLELPPMLPAVSSSSQEPKLSHQDKLEAIQAKLRGRLTAKAKEGTLDQILTNCGFGPTLREASKASEVELPPQLPKRSPTATVVTVDDMLRDDVIEAQATLDVAKECAFDLEASLIPNTAKKAPMEGIKTVRDKIRTQILEKHDTGELKGILHKFVDGACEDAKLQQACDDARLRFQSALVEKHLSGELSDVLETAAGRPLPCGPLQPVPQEVLHPRGAAEEQATVELEYFRGRLSMALTKSIQQGTLPNLLQQAYSISEGSARPATVAGLPGLEDRVPPPAGNSVGSAAPAPSGPVVIARYVGPALGMGGEPGSPSVPLGAVICAPGVAAVPVGAVVGARSATESPAFQRPPRLPKQGSWSSEVGRLNDRTESLESKVEMLIKENEKLRQAVGG